MKKFARVYSLFKAVVFALMTVICFRDYRLILKAMEMGLGVKQGDAWARLGLAALCAAMAASYLYEWWKKGKEEKSQ